MDSPDRKDSLPPAVDQSCAQIMSFERVDSCDNFPKMALHFSNICAIYHRSSPRGRAMSSKPTRNLACHRRLQSFSSPANPNKHGGRARRGLGIGNLIAPGAWAVDKENVPSQAYVARNLTSAQSDASHDTQTVVGHQGISTQESVKQEVDSPKYEFSDVSDFLSEPVESSSFFSSTKSSFYLVKTTTVHEEFEYEIKDNSHFLSQSVKSESYACDLSENDSLHQAAPENSQCQGSGDRPQELREGGDCNIDEQGYSDGSDTRSTEDDLQLDQETAAMAFLLVGDRDGDGATATDWSVGHHHANATVPRHSSSDIPGPEPMTDVTDSICEGGFDATLGSDVTSSVVSGAEARESEPRDSLVSVNLSHRGVRRRCLDFETARRKSMGGGIPRRSLGPGEKSLGGPPDVTMSRNLPPPLLCERTSASSEATNSSSSNGPEEENLANNPRKSRQNLGCGRAKSPGFLRITGLPRGLSSSDKVTETTQPVLEVVANRTAPTGIGLHLNSLTGNSGLHLNSLSGTISFSPNGRDVSQSMCVGSVSMGTVPAQIGMSGLSGSNHGPRREVYATDTVAAVSRCYSMNTPTSLYGSGNTVSFMDQNRTICRDPASLMELGTDAGHCSDFQSSVLGGRLAVDGSRPPMVELVDKKSSSTGKKRLVHQESLPQSNFDSAEEYDSPRSPKKKRKSPTASNEKLGEGCKRCNCKKSKCLKLYCECFAAGTYCVASCTCYDCFNKPEHEETVLATRQQIESRNPLAFAPKIIHAADASPKRGEAIFDTPASARHKRGCNCKKSLCLKKYCECYQAGVGCSEGCRCEGCKNMFGRKEVNEETEEKDILADSLEKESREELDGVPKLDVHEGGLKVERHRGKDLSPLTPTVDCAGQGRILGRSRSSGRKRSSSPLPDVRGGVAQRTCADSSRSSFNLCAESSLAVLQDPGFQLTRIEPSPNTTPKFTRISHLSPRWERLGDICTLTPLPQAPVRPTPASISTLDRTGASPCFNRQSVGSDNSYKPGDLTDFTALGKPSSFQLPPDESPISPSFGRSSQQVASRKTPCTPCLSSSGLTSKEDKGEKRVSQFGNYALDDDDTPAFLRYSEDAQSPLVTKSGSPKQKRVSPPHFEGVMDKGRLDGKNMFDSPLRSSPGLKSGRKFILTAISGTSAGPTVQGHISNNRRKS